MTKEQLEQELDILIRTAYFLGRVDGRQGFPVRDEPANTPSVRIAKDNLVAFILSKPDTNKKGEK